MKPHGYYDLIEAFSRPGCALCRMTKHETHRFIDGILYESSTEPEVQNHVRASRGMCNRHAWQMLEIKQSLLSVAILYEQALDEVIDLLGGQLPTARGMLERLMSNENVLAARLEPDKPCMCCLHIEDFEKRHFDVLASNLDDDKFRDAYLQSDGLCLPHLIRVLRAVRDSRSADLLARTQREKWSHLQVELNMFIDKHALHFGKNAIQEMGDEKDSWRRVLALIAGSKDTV